jgi:protein ImuB
MRRILCIHLPNWPIQCKRELDPRQPIILQARDARRSQLVASCNAAAWDRGMRPSIPLAEATALAHCVVLPADDASDLAALAKLATHCEQFSPLVGWQTVNGPAIKPGHLFLDVTGIEILFGGNLIREVESALDYDAQIAIAETVGTAWAHAVYQEPFPLAALRLSSETVDLLAQVGITQVEQLLKLERASLPARFGEELILRLDQFQGNAPETIVAYRPPPEFVAERLLEYPAESRELLERIVFELIERVAADLAEKRQGAVQLTCRLDSRPPLILRVGLYRPSANPSHLWDLMRLQLEQSLPGPVGRVTLTVQLTAPLQNRQQELFGGHQESRQLELLIDRLRGRLGPNAVVCPHVTSDPLPELAVKYSQLVRKSRPAPEHRPLFLFAPIALNVVSIVPDGRPISFRYASQDHRVSRSWGPERIESGWWRGPSVRRDYYQVETATGLRYWLFRRLQDGKWFLHGEFG